jgi:hypothetical protein
MPQIKDEASTERKAYFSMFNAFVDHKLSPQQGN